MNERSISETWFNRVKAATRDLVKACGGIERSADIAHVGKSTVSRWQSLGEEDIISIPAALALEADCDRPFVTQIMADLNGRSLTDQAARDAAGCLITGHNTLMGKFAELTSEIVSAKADGVVTPAEAEVIDRKAAEMERAASDMRQTLAAKKAGVRLVR